MAPNIASNTRRSRSQNFRHLETGVSQCCTARHEISVKIAPCNSVFASPFIWNHENCLLTCQEAHCEWRQCRMHQDTMSASAGICFLRSSTVTALVHVNWQLCHGSGFRSQPGLDSDPDCFGGTSVWRNLSLEEHLFGGKEEHVMVSCKRQPCRK